MGYREDYIKAKSFMESTYIGDFQKRRMMYTGDHWNPTLINTNISKDAVMPKVNYIKPNIDYILAMLAMDDPTIQVTPTEKNDVQIANDVGELIKRTYNKRKMDSISRYSIKDMLIYSKGYLGVRWNSELDDGDGDVEAYFINPFNVYMEPVAYSLNESYYVHIKWLRSSDYVWEKYQKEISENGQDLFNPSKRGVEVIESWYRPCKEYPKGRHIIWTTEDVLVDEETPYGNIFIPIVEFEYNKISTGDTSSMVQDLWGDQEIFMKTLGYIIDNLRYTNNGGFVTDDEDAPDKVPTDPNKIIKIHQGRIFTALSNPAISPGWFSLLGLTSEVFKDISGVREVNMGTTSRGITAASAIVALQEATKTRRDDIKNKIIVPTMGNFGKIITLLMQQFYTSDKVQKILGRPSEIDNPKILDYDIEFQYSQALPADKSTRLNLGMQMLQLGILDGQALSELLGDPVLSKLMDDSFKRKQEQQQTTLNNVLQQGFQQQGFQQQGNTQNNTQLAPIGVGGK